MSGRRAPENSVVVGRVVKPWGIAGGVVVESMTDNPSRFQSGAQMWLGEELCTVSSARRDKERWVVRFEGVGDRDEAEALRGAELVVDASALQPLAGDQYYVHELIGCRVESPEGESLGTVTGVVPGPRDWLEVEGRGRQGVVADGSGVSAERRHRGTAHRPRSSGWPHRGDAYERIRTVRVDVITIFPGLFPGALGESITARAVERGLLELVVHDLRGFAAGPHHQVDDEPFGGGGGMVLKPEPLFAAAEEVGAQLRSAGVEAGPVILLSPQGEPLRQGRAEELARHQQMTLICGRYEGVDERVRKELVDLELSIGDYVLTGGELPAMVVVDAVTRLQPGALGDAEATRHDSFSEALLDFPQYTRPADFRGLEVPEVLRSGNHPEIASWRRQQALVATARKAAGFAGYRGPLRGGPGPVGRRLESGEASDGVALVLRSTTTRMFADGSGGRGRGTRMRQWTS